MASRRLIALSLVALFASVRGAAADGWAGAANLRIVSVRLADDGAGSSVAVKFAGALRAPVLRVRERLASIALADVDADGDLDILAASVRAGVLLWRNAGRGRFVLARLPKARDALSARPRVSARRRAAAHEEPGEGAGDPAVLRTDIAGDPLVPRSFFTVESFSPLTPDRVAPSGRAPPVTRSTFPVPCRSRIRGIRAARV